MKSNLVLNLDLLSLKKNLVGSGSFFQLGGYLDIENGK